MKACAPYEGSGDPTRRKKRRGSHRKNAETTVDHAKIQEWVEARGGRPATVRGSGGDEPAGILRVDFPGYAGKATLLPISWEVFFKKFEERGLAFLYQEKTSTGELSRFWKLVKRQSSTPEN